MDTVILKKQTRIEFARIMNPDDMKNYYLNSLFLFLACGAVPAIATITNSQSITLAVAGANTYQSVAAVICIPGYTPADAELSCLADGNWETTTCNKVGESHRVCCKTNNIFALVGLFNVSG